MDQSHHSRMVELGQNLGALAQTGTLMTVALVGLAGGLIAAPFRAPSSGCGCGCQHRDRCCYDPPVYRCGGW
jgi:hypothetical protein